MQFTDEEKALLMNTKGVGATVIKRLEQIGIHSLAELSHYEVEEITKKVASMLHSTCWQNSPQAKQAISNAIATAKKEQLHLR